MTKKKDRKDKKKEGSDGEENDQVGSVELLAVGSSLSLCGKDYGVTFNCTSHLYCYILFNLILSGSNLASILLQ